MWAGNLSYIKAQVDNGKKNPDEHFLLKDGWKTDFTTRDPKQPFTLSWDNDVTLSYSDYDEKSGCYKLTLSHQSEDAFRIWVSDEDGDDHDLDTLHSGENGTTSTTLCTKWLHIHVKNDGDSF
ncbi:hypothetical protein EX895_005885 [Sporisorium graminicola]|uniref:Uncharacterized protein n=1 Tax=Sporisorium graminicola TaxID=280036 RepID=A0A4U7KKT2_9BASI|nr:hypothetical protein EX895_005885 [Sporisorium graminicola]TKY84805.1 hypothetical protein EX895_005885 [Sporisorium graminicola]